jgi:hypothetical protein
MIKIARYLVGVLLVLGLGVALLEGCGGAVKQGNTDTNTGANAGDVDGGGGGGESQPSAESQPSK